MPVCPVSSQDARSTNNSLCTRDAPVLDQADQTGVKARRAAKTSSGAPLVAFSQLVGSGPHLHCVWPGLCMRDCTDTHTRTRTLQKHLAKVRKLPPGSRDEEDIITLAADHEEVFEADALSPGALQ
eukprot:scaffold61511_cov20-Tisochrysis_lutea.AAC.3